MTLGGLEKKTAVSLWCSVRSQNELAALRAAAPPKDENEIDSPLSKGDSRLAETARGMSPRTGQPPKAFVFLPPFLRGIFRGAMSYRGHRLLLLVRLFSLTLSLLAACGGKPDSSTLPGGN